MGSPNRTPTWTGSIRKSHTATARLIGRHRPCPRTPGQPSTKLGHVGTQKGMPDALLPTGTLASPSSRSGPPCRTAKGTPGAHLGLSQGKKSPCSQEQRWVAGGIGVELHPAALDSVERRLGGRLLQPNAAWLSAACGAGSVSPSSPHMPAAGVSEGTEGQTG